ncbi:MAG: hypothetical protein KDA84_20175, partial [Planctomycetaceae bacterium]|nr:hypothetical protein [Planctomycetaceae bacterium]
YACVAAEMIVYKLGGFVADQDAYLVDANSEQATLRLGSGGLLGRWGSSEDRQPVTLCVRFATKNSRGQKTNMGPSQKVPVEVTVTPRGRVRKAEMFQSRAKRVVKSLRSFFAAD